MVEIDTPNPADVLCGKDKTFGKHPGNQIYRNLIADRSADYASATSKRAKMDLSKSIIVTMQNKYGSRFLRQVSATSKQEQQEGWVELTNQQARDKATHALRFWNDHKSSKDKSPDNVVGGERNAVISATRTSQGVSSSCVASASTAPSAADLDPEAAFATHQQQQFPHLSTTNNYFHYPPYRPPPGSQQAHSDVEYLQHNHSIQSYYDLNDNPGMGYSAEAVYAASQTHHANNDEQSSVDATSTTSSSWNETTSYATRSENETTIAAACNHERRQQFVLSSLRHDQHHCLHHGEMDEMHREQQQRRVEDDTLDLGILSNRCNESHYEEGHADYMAPLQYPPTPLPPAIDDPDRNSLMLLSTIRSLSLVDCLDDDILVPTHHPLTPNQLQPNEMLFLDAHPLDYQQVCDDRNNGGDRARRRFMNHTEEATLEDMTDIQRLLNDSFESGGSSGSLSDDEKETAR